MVEAMEVTKQKLILVVEDQPADRFLFEDRLRSGYEVESRADSQTALHRLASPGVDLVLLDLQLPFQNGGEDTKAEGYRIIEELRSRKLAGEKVPGVVVVSNYLTPPDTARLHDLGVQHILAKPVPSLLMYQTVEAALQAAA